MEKNRIVLFNFLKKRTKCILQSLQDSNNNLIRDVRDLLQGISGVSDEELELIETVDHLWDVLVRNKVISMDDLQVLKTIARCIKSRELEKEVESYEYESSGAVRRVCLGIAKTAKLVIKTGLPLTVGLAVLSYCGENEVAKQVVLEKLVLPPLVKLDEVCEGSVCFVLETSSLSSLKQLWRSYKDGSLEKKFKKAINEIDEVRKLTQGTEIDVTVEIDEEDYREACWVLVLAKAQEVQVQAGRLEKRRRHSFSCDQCRLPAADKTQLAWADWMTMNELVNSREEAKKQIANLRQEVNKLKEKNAVEKKKLKVKIAKKTEELKLVQKVNEELLKYRYFKALSLSNSFQMLKLVKDACLVFNKSYHESLSMNIKAMKQGDEDAKKVVFGSIERYHMAMQYFEKCLNTTLLDENEAKEISVYGNLGNVFHSLSDEHKAMECYAKALEIAQNSGNKEEQMNAHRNLGIVHSKLNQYNEAIRHHVKQLQVAKDIGDKMEEGKAYENLGAIYSKVWNYKEASEYYEKFLKIATENRQSVSSTDLMRGYKSLADVCKQSEKYNDAIVYYKECLEKATERKDQMKAFEGLGESYEHLENYDEAARNYVKYTEVTDDVNGKANVYERLGNAYRKSGKYDDALIAFEKCLRIAEEIDDDEIQANVYGSMEEIYARLENKKKRNVLSKSKTKTDDEEYQCR